MRILRQKGFTLSLTQDRDEEGMIIPESRTWTAAKNGFWLRADNPVELLGLAAVYEYVQPAENKSYWWSVEGEDIWDELSQQATPETHPDGSEQLGTNP